MRLGKVVESVQNADDVEGVFSEMGLLDISSKNPNSPLGSLLCNRGGKLQPPGIPARISEEACEEQTRGTAHVQNGSLLSPALDVMCDPGQDSLPVQLEFAFQAVLIRVVFLKMRHQFGRRRLRNHVASAAVETFSQGLAPVFRKRSLFERRAQGTAGISSRSRAKYGIR